MPNLAAHPPVRHAVGTRPDHSQPGQQEEQRPEAVAWGTAVLEVRRRALGGSGRVAAAHPAGCEGLAGWAGLGATPQKKTA